MTVKELINKLEQLPQDAEVFVPSQTGGWYQPSDADTEFNSEDIVIIS